MWSRAVPALLLCVGCAPAAGGARARAAEWLWSQQAADGGWHSKTYALLRSGQAYTPFVLHALLQDGRTPPEGAVERALEFIRRHANADGVVGLADPDILEYPNYATAYALRCLKRVGDPKDAALVGRMRDYLVRQQFREENGFAPRDPAYGGWGFGGKIVPGKASHMDLAHTRRVLEALHEAGAPDAVFARAKIFLGGMQGPDGGFYFSPVIDALNKARSEGGRFRSYASATCDGTLSLLAAGMRTESAFRWLDGHPRLDYPQGIPEDHPEPWGAALFFYHLAVRAEAYRAVGRRVDGIEALLAPLQQGDGRFFNAKSPLMKEDDPLLATALALIALR
jgi:hypothetical protein